MKVLVVGAGRLGAQVIKQLRKNEGMEIVVAEAHPEPFAVKSGIIGKVDFAVHVTPLNFDEVVEMAKPDLVVLARTVKDWDQSDAHMGTEYVLGMERELTRTRVPVIPACGDVLGPY